MTVNRSVAGESPAELVDAVARALGGPMMMRCDGCSGCVWTRCASCPQPGQPCACAGVPGADPELARIAIAAVRAWDASHQCGAPHPFDAGMTCLLPPGHEGKHGCASAEWRQRG